jgi:predicted amidohydrolase YtcJ
MDSGRQPNELTLTEKRMPTAAELDRIAPDHPVYPAARHLPSVFVQHRALEIVKQPLGLPGVDLAEPANGVVRDPAS